MRISGNGIVLSVQEPLQSFRHVGAGGSDEMVRHDPAGQSSRINNQTQFSAPGGTGNFPPDRSVEVKHPDLPGRIGFQGNFCRAPPKQLRCCPHLRYDRPIHAAENHPGIQHIGEVKQQDASAGAQGSSIQRDHSHSLVPIRIVNPEKIRLPASLRQDDRLGLRGGNDTGAGLRNQTDFAGGTHRRIVLPCLPPQPGDIGWFGLFH